MLLALDTATDAISVALHDGESPVAERAVVASRRHAEVLMPLIAEVMDHAGVAPADLTRIAVGVGPGAFTGLRVGLVTARTMALALDVDCVGVLTVDALAHAALLSAAVAPDEDFAVGIDARRREVFWCRYSHGRRIGEPQAEVPSVLASGRLEGLTVVGDAVTAYPDVFPRAIALSPSAASIAVIAEGTDERFDVVPAEPVYVRRPDATEPGTRKPVSTPAVR